MILSLTQNPVESQILSQAFFIGKKKMERIF